VYDSSWQRRKHEENVRLTGTHQHRVARDHEDKELLPLLWTMLKLMNSFENLAQRGVSVVYHFGVVFLFPFKSDAVGHEAIWNT